MRRIAPQHGKVVILARIMEADRQAEAIGKRQIVVHCIARIERIRLPGDIARQDGATVCGHREAHIGRTRIDTAIEPTAKMPRGNVVVGREAEIVDENEEIALRLSKRCEQARQRGDGIGGNLHQRNLAVLRLRFGHRDPYQRGLAHAARSPQQHVVRGMALRQPSDIGGDGIFLRIDPAQQRKWQRVDRGDRSGLVAIPDIGRGGQPIGLRIRQRCEPIERCGDPRQTFSLVIHGRKPYRPAGWATSEA